LTAGRRRGDNPRVPDLATPATPAISTPRLVLASVVGTAIEFYDFYIYATAAVLVMGPLFFPKGRADAQSLASLATFGIAFVARPFGSVLFGHFGDRVGRKATLVASLLTMGISTTCVGLLPTYRAVGALAPALLCVLRLGQGIGLGGEWGGAALVATENAPAGRQAWFGMFPQLGPPIGFLLANGLFLLLVRLLSPAQFAAWGWRVPFLGSAVLVVVGLVVRTQVGETPAFLDMAAHGRRVRVPLGDLVRRHGRALLLGSLAMVTSYGPFYIATVFSLDYGTHAGHLARGTFLGLLCLAIPAMAVMSVVSARLADRFGCWGVLLVGSAMVAASGFATAPLLGSHTVGGALAFLLLMLGLTGFVFGPMGALLPSLFPPEVRYTGAAAAYSFGGILGASLAPYAAQVLVAHGGLPWVGYYVSAAGLVSLSAAVFIRRR
jgi:MFS family permease